MGLLPRAHFPPGQLPQHPQALRLKGAEALEVAVRWATKWQGTITLVEWARPGEAVLHRALIRRHLAKPLLLGPILPALLPPLEADQLSKLLDTEPATFSEAWQVVAAREYRHLATVHPGVKELVLFLAHPQVNQLLGATLEGTAWTQLPHSPALHLLLSPSLTRWWQWALALLEAVLHTQGRLPQPEHPLMARKGQDVWLTWNSPLTAWPTATALQKPPSWLTPSHTRPTVFLGKRTYALEALL